MRLQSELNARRGSITDMKARIEDLKGISGETESENGAEALLFVLQLELQYNEAAGWK